MCRYLCSILVAAFCANSVSAFAQTRRDVYELQERCGKRAEEIYKREWGFGVSNTEDRQITGHYENHYNMRLNKCFYLEISTSYERADAQRKSNLPAVLNSLRLFDINDNKEYATFHEGPIVYCMVGEKFCKSQAEWRELIKSYMED